jgi:hypothetical protein
LQVEALLISASIPQMEFLQQNQILIHLELREGFQDGRKYK